MDTQSLLIIYVILLVLTIVFAAMKKTTWWSLMGVALIPIYFLIVLWDVLQSSLSEDEEESAEGQPEGQAGEQG